MADFILAIKDILENDAGVIALAEDRVYNATLPDDPTYPALVYSLVIERPIPDHNAGETKDYQNRYQIDAHGEDAAAASSLRDAALAALDNKPRGIYGGISVQGILFIDGTPDYESDIEIDKRIFDVMMFARK